MKKSFQTLLLIALVFNFVLKSHGQTGAPEDVFKNQMTEKIKSVSPNSAAFEKVALLPVNLSTGSAEINIPIFQVQGKKLSLPISLSYQSNGIKVEENASWVGLGWTLNAGGVIMQQVQGLAETGMINNHVTPERAGPFPQKTILADAEDAYLRGVYNYPVGTDPSYFYHPSYIKDPAADIFIYNFCGQSGKFVLKSDGTPVFSPQKNYKVSYGGLSNTTITDDNGNKYIYTKSETSYTSASASSTNFTYASYLTQIVSSDGQEIINLSYVAENHIQYPLPAYDGLVDYYGLHIEPVPYVTSGIEVVRLSEITTNFGIQVKFIPEDQPRADLLPGNNVKALKRIEIYQNNSLFKSYLLDKEYVQTANEIPPNLHAALIPNPDYLNKRLYLKELRVVSNNPAEQIPPYTFSYYGRTSNNLDLLPHKFSYAQDHWGFYNGELYNNGLCPGYIGPYYDMLAVGGTIQINAPNANREPSFDYSVYGTIKKVKYPTGGEIEFIYEPHTYNEVEILNPNAPNANTSGIAGGVRLKTQIITDPLTNKTLTKTYSYSKGRVCNPVYSSYIIKNAEGFLSYSQYISTDPSWISKSVIRVGARSLYNLFSYNGSHIYYENVTEKETGNGYNEYTFSPVALGLPDNPLTLIHTNVVYNGLCCHAVETYVLVPYMLLGYNSNSTPFSSAFAWSTAGPITKSWLYGHLLAKRSFNESGQLLAEEVNKYDFQDIDYNVNNQINTIDNVNVDIKIYGPETIIPHAIGVEYFRYPTLMGTSLLKSKSNTIHSGAGQLQQTEDIIYNTRLVPGAVIRVNSDGSKNITKYKYPYDYDFSCTATLSGEAAAIKKLVEKNMVASPVEVQVIVEKNGIQSLVSSQLTTFQIIGDAVYPRALYVVDQNGPLSDMSSSSISCSNGTGTLAKHSLYTKRVDYLKFDNQGNLIESVDQKGITSSWAWNQQFNHPTAEAINAKAGEIYFGDFEQNGWNASITSPLSAYDNTRAHTGRFSGRIDNTGPGEKTVHSDTYLPISLTQPTKFTYSGWVYSTGPSAEIFLFMKTAQEQGYYTYVAATSTNQTNKWTYIQGEYTVPADITQLNIRIDNNGAGTVWFDDIRVHPSNALMTTYTYTPLIGMTSQTDAHGRTTYYEYDGLGRLVLVRDNDQRILQRYDYKYQEQQ